MKLSMLLFLILSFTSFGQSDTLSLYFHYDRTSLVLGQDSLVNDLKAKLSRKSAKIKTCKAYCDTAGTLEYNMDLCQRRLEASFEALGIDSTDLALRPRVYGDNIPRNLMKNYSDSLFRRVDVFYTESKIPLNLQLPTPEMNKKKLNAFVSNSDEEEMMLEFGILFHPGLDLILPESFRELKDLALFLNKHQNLKLHIRGHVCCGPHLALSNQRARKVSDYLTIHGIKKDRITAKGYSNTLPAVTPELTEAQARRNRRVDIIFTKMK